jgi:heme/copper-type cytochrome/quinol oxidase subunit 2
MTVLIYTANYWLLQNKKMFLNKNILTDSPASWQIFFQNPATPVMEGIIYLHNYIFMYLILVFVVVMWFLVRSLYLFNSDIYKTSTEFTHDYALESVWTIAPAFILVLIAIPSFSLLYSMDDVIDPYITVKAIGHQWYWSYEIDVYSNENVSDYLAYGFYTLNERNFHLLAAKHFNLAGVKIKIIPAELSKLITYRFLTRYIVKTEACFECLECLLPSGRILRGSCDTTLLPAGSLGRHGDLFMPKVGGVVDVTKQQRDADIALNTFTKKVELDFADRQRKQREIDVSFNNFEKKVAIRLFKKYKTNWELTHQSGQLLDLKAELNFFERYVADWKLKHKLNLKAELDFFKKYVADWKLKNIGRFSKKKQGLKTSDITVNGIFLKHPAVSFDSYMTPESDLAVNDTRLLSVDNTLVLPVKTHIRLLITSTDVIHSWSVPSFGIKVDAVPGRLNQTALYINQPGVFYGQCSELCGVNHGFMPICVKGVSMGDFNKYVHDFNTNRTNSISDCLDEDTQKLRIFIK